MAGAGPSSRGRPGPACRVSARRPDAPVIWNDDVGTRLRHCRCGRGLRAAFGLSFFVCDGTVITSDMGAALPLPLGLATGDGRAAGLTRGGVVLTVNADRDVVERQLGGGELACPSCGGVLARWGERGRAADAAAGWA